MASAVVEAANKTKGWLLANGVLSAEHFNPGLDVRQLEEAERELGWRLPQEARDLYQWHDGTWVPDGTLLSQRNFLPGYYFISLREALDAKRLHEQMNEKMPADIRHVPGVLWQPDWLPVFDSGNNKHLALDCSRATEHGAPIIDTDIETGLWTFYASLTALMQTTARCCAEDAFFVQNGWVEVDQKRQAAIARTLNPGVEFWWFT